MTAEGRSSTFQCLRWIVFVLNFLFWVAGMGVLGVALWLLFDADFAKAIDFTGTGLNNYYTGVYILLAVGLLMTFFGFLGCCGALRKSQLLLTLFFILLLIVFIIELVCGILMYYYQEDLRKYAEDSMLDAIKKYGQTPYSQAVDQIQSGFQCCGARSYTNWLMSSYVQGQHSDVIGGEYAEVGSLAQGVGAVPLSCCTAKGKQAYPDCGSSFNQAPLYTFVNKDRPEDSFIYPKGCNQAIYDYYYDRSNLIIGLAIGIGCVQLLGMVLTMALCCWISSYNRSTTKSRY